MERTREGTTRKEAGNVDQITEGKKKRDTQRKKTGVQYQQRETGAKRKEGRLRQRAERARDRHDPEMSGGWTRGILSHRKKGICWQGKEGKVKEERRKKKETHNGTGRAQMRQGGAETKRRREKGTESTAKGLCHKQTREQATEPQNAAILQQVAAPLHNCTVDA